MAKIKREIETIDEAALLQSIHEQDKSNSGVISSKAQENPAEPVDEQPEQSVEHIDEQPAPPIELVERQSKKPEQPEKSKEVKEPVKRKRNQVDYSSQFLQKNELKERSCVYISRRVHVTISEIVRVIANRDVTVGGYIDSVLLQHLETHRDEINELYKKERKDLIEF